MHDTQSTQARLPLGLRLLPTIILAGLAWIIAQQPMLLLVLSAVASLVGHQLRRERNYLRGLAAQRQGESICQFARAFPRRQVDTWVLRAVYESLHGYLGGRLPIRADDRLKQDLRLDDDDLDLDLLEEMARLSGRSLERTADNPWFDRVTSVRDLVLFLDHQPRLSAS
jgi:hypothetical protein